MLEAALISLLAPLVGGCIAGLACRRLSRAATHGLTIAAMVVASVAGIVLLILQIEHGAAFEHTLYHWADLGSIRFEVGLLIDRLSASMVAVVCVVSLLVHIYSIGYMHDEPTSSYNRFFSYISLFTFAMLALVMANNFLQLFFGWEGVGLMSYLLIGFWFQRPSAAQANLKAFLVNRIGDFGFLLGIGLVAACCASLNYGEVFGSIDVILAHEGYTLFGGGISLATAICLLLFVGAMGKSAQVPLHVWLPDSMEGPTPISALIHAATMVTAGIFMVARMSPLFELSPVALETVMVIGALTALSMGLVGLVQNDIKRVVAYSTLSQLGYMTVALGFSAYHLAIFHLITHAFFKALLFLAAGSVIVALHHEQDIRKMGGLRRQMPITHATALIGSLALIGFPGFSGFYSKDLIIEFAHARADGLLSELVWLALLVGVFVTALYSFRMLFMVFYGKPRYDAKTASQLRESPKLITLPLLALALPSIVLGIIAVDWFLANPGFGGAIHIAEAHQVDASGLGWLALLTHAPFGAVFWLAAAGLGLAWMLYGREFDLSGLRRSLAKPISLLERKYGFDDFYMSAAPRWTLAFARVCWRFFDQRLIDQTMVLGTARLVALCSAASRRLQSGYIHDYIMGMVLAMALMWAVGLFLP